MEAPLVKPTVSRFRLLVAAGFVWFAVVSVSAAWNWRHIGGSTRMLAEIEARAYLENDLLYRKWATVHGGVYVPPSANTPPNPHLAHLPERDVTTTSGKRLTLINPSYLTRLVQELGQQQSGFKSRLTSLQPLRPENTADAWEAEALRSFQSGAAEAITVGVLDGQPHIRVMRPIATESICLKCHAAQGYQVGDLRSGISVSKPLAPYLAVARQQRVLAVTAHALVGGLGLIGLCLGGLRLGRSEKSLAERERHYRSVINGLHEDIMVIGRDYRVVDLNNAARERLGTAHPSPIGRFCHEISHGSMQPCDEHGEVCPVQRVFETGEPFRCHHAHVAAGGAVTHVDIQASALKDEGGNVTHVVEAMRDISDLIVAHEELRKRDERLAETNQILAGVLEHTHMMAVFLDPRFNFIWVNRAYAETCQHEPSFFPGKNHFDLYPNEDLQGIFQRVVDTGTPYFVEGRPFEFPDQPERGVTYWDLSLIAVKDDAGKVTGLVFTLAEVTERARAQKALALQSRIAMIFASTADEDLIYEVLDLVLEAMQSLEGAFGYLDQDGTLVMATLSPALDREGERRAHTVRLPEPAWGDSPWARAIREKQGFCSNAICPPSEGQGEMQRHVAVPILSGSEVIGHCFVVGKATEYSRAEVELMGMIAGYLAPILNARLQAWRAQADLKRIEWMLAGNAAQATESKAEACGQSYGDLTELNRQEGILRCLGRETLESIAGTYLDLLGTSSAIYESNGDYACGIFASGWCRMMDEASRGLCGTADNGEALASGRWLCHESCWMQCSRETIAQRAPVDIECRGGLHLYGVPIFSGGEVIGSINVGYGDPPADPVKLRELSSAYGVEYDDLLREARAYASRPPFIIAKAKRNLAKSARLIGLLVTQRRWAEAERDRLQMQFHQAQKMETVGRLAGGVAHDFNNLLTVINGYGQFLLDKMEEHDSRKAHVTQILEAGDRAAGLTRQLLAFSRKQVMQPQVLNLNQVLEGMRPMLERLVREDVELCIQPGAEIGTVRADPHQLEQVIMNLVVNARDAMPTGGRILIETGGVECSSSPQPDAEPRSGRFVMLAVSDSGVGMDEETKAHIFEPFFTTKEPGQGSGLGLAMVQGIVAQSGGYIDVHSRPGAGTTFKVYLPWSAAAPPRHEKAAAIPPLGGHETVLVVEDQVEVRKYAAAVLAEYGYTIVQARNAVEALAQCERDGEIDLVLTDVVMPEISGQELAEQVKRLRPGIKVLFMSGYTDDVIVRHGVSEGSAEFLQKPFTPGELARKVRAVLGPEQPV